ncbi:hypothetical protein ACFV1L_29235 [Kitasatospora sp. NPDC059646]|uniref:hypothetical protein n=1 Tax=Kitasatospora sp. NPDC059646 TaxID=3346893 RepID=UPI0036C209CB
MVVDCRVAPRTTAQFDLRSARPHDLVMVRVSGALYGTAPQLFGPNGKRVACVSPLDPSDRGRIRCATDGAGPYTLRLENTSSETLSIALSYLPVLSTDTCVGVGAADLSPASPALFRGSVPAGLAGTCYRTGFASGDLMRLTGSGLDASVFDATGAQVCRSGNTYADCRLTGAAPYRVVVEAGWGDERGGYQLTLSRLSRPDDCPVVEPQAFGTAPDLTDTTRCRILRVPADGRYLFRGTGEIGDKRGFLYRADALRRGEATALCPTRDCDLTAGDYVYTLDPSTYSVPYAMVLHSVTETRGCTVGRDDQMASGAPVENFGAAGRDRCRTLPTASGEALYVLNGTATGGTARYRVLDAAGAEQCRGFTVNDTYQVCRLTGAAPFRLVADARGAFDHRLLVQRVGETAGCTPWAASAYGTGSGVRTGLSGRPADGALENCFAVPADHPAVELVGYRLAGPQYGSVLHLVDPSGTEFCTIVSGRTGTCRPPAGRPYTAVLTNGLGRVDFTVVRRDATPAAACDLPAASGRIGSPSAGFTFDSSVDAHCTTFDAAAADLLQVSTHAGTDQAIARVTVVDAEGRRSCSTWEADCRVTGSTRYLAAVASDDPLGRVPFPGGLDVWRLATAAGWAPECAAHPVSADGFAPLSGTLSDDSPLYCAVLEMQPGRRLDVAAAVDDDLFGARLTVAGRENWADDDTAYTCARDLAFSAISTVCTYRGTGTGHAVLLFSPGRAHLPLAFTLQGARPGTGTARSGVPEALTPSSGTGGSYVEATVRGTGLSLNSQLKLRSRDVWCGDLEMRPLRVNADGTELQVRIDVLRRCAGSFDLVVEGVTYRKGVPVPGYLPDAFTVVAPAG